MTAGDTTRHNIWWRTVRVANTKYIKYISITGEGARDILSLWTRWMTAEEVKGKDPPKTTAKEEKTYLQACVHFICLLEKSMVMTTVPFNMVPFRPGQSQCTCAITADCELNIRATNNVDLGGEGDVEERRAREVDWRRDQAKQCQIERVTAILIKVVQGNKMVGCWLYELVSYPPYSQLIVAWGALWYVYGNLNIRMKTCYIPL